MDRSHARIAGLLVAAAVSLSSPAAVCAQTADSAVVYGLGGVTFVPAGGAIGAGVRVPIGRLQPLAEIGWLNRLPTDQFIVEGDAVGAQADAGLRLKSFYALFGARVVVWHSTVAPYVEGTAGIARGSLEIRPEAGQADVIRAEGTFHETDGAAGLGAGLATRLSERAGVDVGYRHLWVYGRNPFTVQVVYAAITLSF